MKQLKPVCCRGVTSQQDGRHFPRPGAPSFRVVLHLIPGDEAQAPPKLREVSSGRSRDRLTPSRTAHAVDMKPTEVGQHRARQAVDAPNSRQAGKQHRRRRHGELHGGDRLLRGMFAVGVVRWRRPRDQVPEIEVNNTWPSGVPGKTGLNRPRGYRHKEGVIEVLGGQLPTRTRRGR